MRSPMRVTDTPVPCKLLAQFRFLLVHVIADRAAGERADAGADQCGVAPSDRRAADRKPRQCAEASADRRPACRIGDFLLPGKGVGRRAGAEIGSRNGKEDKFLEHGLMISGRGFFQSRNQGIRQYDESPFFSYGRYVTAFIARTLAFSVKSSPSQQSMNVLEELADRVVARIGDRQRLQSELLPRLERRQAR